MYLGVACLVFGIMRVTEISKNQHFSANCLDGHPRLAKWHLRGMLAIMIVYGWTGTSSDLVKQELERVLQSKAFRNAEALSKLLRFVVARTLEGDTEGLKEYSLGSQVLDRGPGFDPQADPIVRVQAGRLRSKLETRYPQNLGGRGARRLGNAGSRFKCSPRAHFREGVLLPGD